MNADTPSIPCNYSALTPKPPGSAGTEWINNRESVQTVTPTVSFVSPTLDVEIPIDPDDIVGMTWLSDVNPQGLGDNVQELDLTLYNDDFAYDVDNPSSLFYKADYTGWFLKALYSMPYGDGIKSFTCPVGIFSISTYDYDETTVRLVAYDLRSMLTAVEAPFYWGDDGSSEWRTPSGQRVTENVAIQDIATQLTERCNVPAGLVDFSGAVGASNPRGSERFAFSDDGDPTVKAQLDSLMATRLAYCRLTVARDSPDRVGKIVMDCVGEIQRKKSIPYTFTEQVLRYPVRNPNSVLHYGTLDVQYTGDDELTHTLRFSMLPTGGSQKVETVTSGAYAYDREAVGGDGHREWAQMIAYGAYTNGASVQPSYSFTLLNAPEVSAGDIISIAGRWDTDKFFVISQTQNYSNGTVESEVIAVRDYSLKTWGDVKNSGATWGAVKGTDNTWLALMEDGSNAVVELDKMMGVVE